MKSYPESYVFRKKTNIHSCIKISKFPILLFSWSENVKRGRLKKKKEHVLVFVVRNTRQDRNENN